VNPVVAFSASGVLFALFNALLAARLSKAPGWGHLRYLAVNALALVAVSAARTVECLDRSPSVVVALRFEVAAIGVGVLAWFAYSRAHLGLARTRLERAYEIALGTCCAVALIPGAAYTEPVIWRRVPPGLTFVDPTATWFGVALYATLLTGGVALLARYVGAARRGVPGAHAHILGILFAAVPFTWDAAASTVGANLPYITDPGIFLSLSIVPLALAETFRAEFATRREEESGLAALVAERTTALGLRRDDLARSEELASLGRLAAGVSHEINSPIAAANANVEWLLEVGDDEPQDEVLAALVEAGAALDRVRRIVRQLAHITGAPTASAKPQRVLLDPTLRQAAVLACAMRGKEVPIEVERPPEALCALGDEGAIVQIVVNLLVNAVDAVRADGSSGRIAVRAATATDRVAVTVEDDGPGMSTETLARVFEPFFTTKPVGHGTGLGLAVSRGLAASLGGALRIDSRPGEGTRVTLELPAAPSIRPDARAKEEGDAAPARRRRLLLVDDEPAVRSSLRRLLSRHHDVDVAGSVDEALELFARRTYDLVLCDLVMPDGGGERLYRTVEREDVERAGRFVFVTGGAPDEAARRFLAAQPQPVLDKPIDLAALDAILRDVAAASRRSRSSVNPSS
jgi:signal transduction histidine kinase/ActR/RegA family two-component response regulator